MARKFSFSSTLCHYAGEKETRYRNAIRNEASPQNIEVKTVSVEKAKGDDLLADQPYTHISDGRNAIMPGFHCKTFTRLRFREAEGMPRPVCTKQYPHGRPQFAPGQRRDNGIKLSCHPAGDRCQFKKRQGGHTVERSRSLFARTQVRQDAHGDPSDSPPRPGPSRLARNESTSAPG